MFIRRRRQQSAEATKAAAYDDNSSSETPQMRQNDDRFSRESGALGPYMANPSPNWEHQEALERERWEQQYQGHNQQAPSRSPGRMSQKDHLPFEPMATHSEEHSRESSRHSWIDQFDFERPGYQDADEMSQARRSIHAAPSERPFDFGEGADSHATISHVGDVPQLPEFAHHSETDDNWPLRY